MEIKVRERTRRPVPSDRELAYGPYVGKVIEGTPYFKDLQDRSAYVAITGQFPSHLRKEFTALLRRITDDAILSSLDRRNGYCALKPWPFKHLKIERHAMYLAARGYVERGYKITASRGFGTRRAYGKVFLSTERDGGVTHQITINIDGSVKQGW